MICGMGINIPGFSDDIRRFPQYPKGWGGEGIDLHDDILI
jgi:hypothetical protein